MSSGWQAGKNNLGKQLIYANCDSPHRIRPQMLNRRPTIGVDFHVFDGIFQGSRSHLLGLYRSAILQGSDIDFIFFLEQVDLLRETYPEFSKPNVRLVRTGKNSGIWRLLVQLPLLQRKHRLDLLHTQYRIPIIRFGRTACTIHDLLFETHPQFFKRLFVLQAQLTFRFAAKHASILFSVSDFSRKEIERLYRIPASRIALTYNGVDRSKFKPGLEGLEYIQALGLQSGRYLLTVGRLEPRKNHLTLLQAYAGLGPDVPPLVIVGQRDFGYDVVFETIEKLGLRSRVNVLEGIDDTVLPHLMRHAVLFVFPAYAEGFGMPVVEAMASGVPVITSDSCALPEVAGPAGLLIQPDSSAALGAAIKMLLSEPARRKQMVAVGLQHIALFDWENSALTFLQEVRRECSTSLACQD